MVLGPSQYRDAKATHAIEAEPLQVRKDLVKFLTEELGDRATIMEAWAQEPEETNSALFDRILREDGVRAFLVYWPLGAKTSGLEVELGFLLQKFKYEGFPPKWTYLLVEEDLTVDDPGQGTMSTARMALNEKGNRTRYHDDLLKLGCRLRIWDTAESLLRHTSEVRLETEGMPPWGWR